MKPTIGLDSDLALRTNRKREKMELFRDYTDSVERAGGIPVILPVTDSPGRIDEQLDLIDGLVLTGGDDLSPQFYGAKKHPKTEPMHPSRELYGIELARAVIRRKIPTLAICGGLQLVNVVCGGDLIQHLPDAVDSDIEHTEARMHEVVIEPETLLARIIAAERLMVNSSHHQAAGRVGGGLRIAARSADGVIEALESKTDAFLVGVQWHPERLTAEHAEHLALFTALVEASSEESEAA